MILQVITASGEVLHDCRENGCTISWDGIALRDLSPGDLHTDEKTRPANYKAVKMGAKVPNAGEVDLTRFKIAGRKAILKDSQSGS